MLQQAGEDFGFGEVGGPAVGGHYGGVEGGVGIAQPCGTGVVEFGEGAVGQPLRALRITRDEARVAGDVSVFEKSRPGTVGTGGKFQNFLLRPFGRNTPAFTALSFPALPPPPTRPLPMGLRVVAPHRSIPFRRSRLRQSLTGSPFWSCCIVFTLVAVVQVLSVALHPASRRRGDFKFSPDQRCPGGRGLSPRRIALLRGARGTSSVWSAGGWRGWRGPRRATRRSGIMEKTDEMARDCLEVFHGGGLTCGGNLVASRSRQIS